MNIQDSLNDVIAASPGLDDVDLLTEHYAAMGVDVRELVDVVEHYLGGAVPPSHTPLVMSLAGRLFEVGYRHGRSRSES